MLLHLYCSHLQDFHLAFAEQFAEERIGSSQQNI